MSSYFPFRWGLEKLRLREVKASVEDVVGVDEVSAKTAPLQRKKDSIDEVPVYSNRSPACGINSRPKASAQFLFKTTSGCHMFSPGLVNFQPRELFFVMQRP